LGLFFGLFSCGGFYLKLEVVWGVLEGWVLAGEVWGGVVNRSFSWGLMVVGRWVFLGGWFFLGAQKNCLWVWVLMSSIQDQRGDFTSWGLCSRGSWGGGLGPTTPHDFEGVRAFFEEKKKGRWSPGGGILGHNKSWGGFWLGVVLGVSRGRTWVGGGGGFFWDHHWWEVGGGGESGGPAVFMWGFWGGLVLEGGDMRFSWFSSGTFLGHGGGLGFGGGGGLSGSVFASLGVGGILVLGGPPGVCFGCGGLVGLLGSGLLGWGVGGGVGGFVGLFFMVGGGGGGGKNKFGGGLCFGGVSFCGGGGDLIWVFVC